VILNGISNRLLRANRTLGDCRDRRYKNKQQSKNTRHRNSPHAYSKIGTVSTGILHFTLTFAKTIGRPGVSRQAQMALADLGVNGR
jgi:hypothetical protein